MKHEFVILGGGLAGLAAAIRLAEWGAFPLLIEAGNYPSHKVCGEFLSPSCLALLHRWHIFPILLHQAHLHTPTRSWTFSFPSPAGSLSHIALDPALVDLARQKGATILTSTRVEHLHPAHKQGDSHELVLATGESLQAAHLIVAAGRLPCFGLSPPKRYMGIKAHFKGIPLAQSLEMFSFPEAYVGLAPIENDCCNVACLAELQSFSKHESAEAFMQSLCVLHPLLKAYLSEGHNLFYSWMQTSLPTFGIKKTPDWHQTYFIGDAAGTIPPACGNGLSMALTSGCLAADYAIKGDDKGFKKAWKKGYRTSILMGKVLHHLALHPQYGSLGLQLSRAFPSLARLFFSLTR